jgi:hypothetical protein
VKAQTVTALALAAAMATCATAAAQPAAAARKGEPRIDQMVVLPGKQVLDHVRAKRTSVKIGKRRCAVAAATPLAALLRSKPGKIGFHDYGACSKRPADGAGLFVKSIRRYVNTKRDGWVYKLRHRLATAGAADPSGPFGSGRLRTGDRVVWFYCRQRDTGSCQRSLELELSPAVAGLVSVTVTGYDDAGEGVPVSGATVTADGTSATTDASGAAQLELAPGSEYEVRARRKGMIPSFPAQVET